MSGAPPLSEEAAHLIASIVHSPIATVITDARQPDNPIVAANDAFLALTGYERAEVLGRNCRFLGGEGTDPGARKRLGRAVATGQPALVELVNYRKDRSPFTNAVMIAPVHGEHGQAVLFVGSQMQVAGPALGHERRQRAAEMVGSLTSRQRQVLGLLVQGLRNKQIAARLGIGEKTVKLHRSAMLARLQSPTSADAIRIGIEAGLPAPGDLGSVP